MLALRRHSNTQWLEAVFSQWSIPKHLSRPLAAPPYSGRSQRDRDLGAHQSEIKTSQYFSVHILTATKRPKLRILSCQTQTAIYTRPENTSARIQIDNWHDDDTMGWLGYDNGKMDKDFLPLQRQRITRIVRSAAATKSYTTVPEGRDTKSSGENKWISVA